MEITIIGSIIFLEKFEEVKDILELKGHKVNLPKKIDHIEPIPQDIKLETMKEFNKSLENSDAVLVLNYIKNDKEGYIGVNTLMEIGMAFNRNKKIFILNKIPDFCKHELESINCIVLDGNLDIIQNI